MKKNLTLFFVFLAGVTFSQLNMALESQLDLSNTHPGIEVNDVWGYTDENNNEYAIVGTTDGTAIVDVTDPGNPVEIFWEPGLSSPWRDIKVNGDYAYVTTEAENGLLIIDMSPLPSGTNLVTSYYYGTPGTNEWSSAHNIWIDENDRAYIFGANGSNNGVIILDISSPMSPVEIGGFDDWYAHDGFVRNDIGYFAHINDGFFSVVDLTTPSAPVLLGTQNTPNNFAHNIWPNDQGNVVFTTDEVSDGYIAAYDVSNPANIQKLDQIQSSPGEGIIPHNAHVLGNYIVTSYYTDGVVIHDASSPSNLVEVAHYDTSPFDTPDFHGCWGVYPFFASGTIVASDIDEGLFILTANYKEAAYAHGKVTDNSNGNPILNAEVEILNDVQPDHTDNNGDYQVGTVDQSAFDLAFFKVGYYRDTLYNVPLTPGDTTIADIALTPIPQFPLTIEVVDQNLQPLSNIKYRLEHEYIDYSGVSNGNGEVQLDLFYEDEYKLYVGQWGYETFCNEQLNISQSTGTIQVVIDEGYYDDFTFDLGWSAFGDASQGIFERGVPVVAGSAYVENPDGDIDSDCGENAYVTGLAGDNVFDGGTTLISPVFDATTYTNPFVGFYHFYFNFWGDAAPNDTLHVYLSNGVENVEIFRDFYDNPDSDMSVWLQHEFEIGNYVTPTQNMQLIVSIEDQTDFPNITEAAIDRFVVTEGSGVDIEKNDQEKTITLYPNPTSGVITLVGIDHTAAYKIIAIDGKVVQQGQVSNMSINVNELAQGYYTLMIQNKQQSWEKLPFSKQ